MNTHSPLVPQGSIPPKNTSRSARVLLIGLTVVICHVAGLGLILLQGCQKDGVNATADASNSTNSNLTLPPIDNTNNSPYYTSASNLPPAITAGVVSNPTPIGVTQPLVTSTPPVTAFATNLVEPPLTTEPAAPEIPTTDYKIVARDHLSGIAARHHVTLNALLAANPNVDPKKLRVGQVIKIPAVPKPTPPPGMAATSGASATGAAPTGVAGSYKVKPGDTLTRIARAHGITVNQLRAANNMRTTQVLAGRVLKIPAKVQNTAAAPASGAPAQQ